MVTTLLLKLFLQWHELGIATSVQNPLNWWVATSQQAAFFLFLIKWSVRLINYLWLT